MTDKERLQKIIDDWEYGKEHEGDPTAALEYKDIDWLIEMVKLIIK